MIVALKSLNVIDCSLLYKKIPTQLPLSYTYHKRPMCVFTEIVSVNVYTIKEAEPSTAYIAGFYSQAV